MSKNENELGDLDLDSLMESDGKQTKATEKKAKAAEEKAKKEAKAAEEKAKKEKLPTVIRMLKTFDLIVPVFGHPEIMARRRFVENEKVRGKDIIKRLVTSHAIFEVLED